MSTPAVVRPRPVHRAADLLAAYLPGSFFYSSTTGSLLADGVHATVGAGHGTRAAAVAEALDAAAVFGVEDPVVVGAIGFRPDAEASLVVPAVVRRAVVGQRELQPARGAVAGLRVDGAAHGA
ncbi:hypothetical protein ACFV4N_17675, partial [Actinosynnema sp. NPDC059797]